MRLFFRPKAVADLESIGDYIARDNPLRARSFVAELRQQCNKIADNPAAYRSRPELAKDLRSCVYSNYVIFFAVESDAVMIVRILHGAMDISALFKG